MYGIPIGNISPMGGADFTPLLAYNQLAERRDEFKNQMAANVRKMLQDEQQAALTREAQQAMNQYNQEQANTRESMQQDAITKRLGMTQNYQREAQDKSIQASAQQQANANAQRDKENAGVQARYDQTRQDRMDALGRAQDDATKAADVDVQANDILGRIVKLGMGDKLSQMPAEAAAIAQQVYPQDAMQQAALIQSLNVGAQQYMRANLPAQPANPQQQLKDFQAQLQMALLQDRSYNMAYQQIDQLNGKLQQLDQTLQVYLAQGNAVGVHSVQAAMQEVQNMIGTNEQMAEAAKQRIVQSLLGAPAPAMAG